MAEAREACSAVIVAPLFFDAKVDVDEASGPAKVDVHKRQFGGAAERVKEAHVLEQRPLGEVEACEGDSGDADGDAAQAEQGRQVEASEVGGVKAEVIGEGGF